MRWTLCDRPTATCSRRAHWTVRGADSSTTSSDLERRVLAGVKRREASVMRDIATVRGSLYPGGTRQERQLSFVPFLAKYGPELVDAMLGAARLHARALVGDVTSIAAPSVETAARV